MEPRLTSEVEKILSQNMGNKGGFSLHYLLLFSIVYGMEAKNVFEFGCGFSSKTILSALKLTGGKLTTCDKRLIENTGNNQSDLENAGNHWRYMQKLSKDGLKDVREEIFDVVLHDGAHDFFTVAKDIHTISRQIKQNGIILVHDTYHPKIRFMRAAIRVGLLLSRYEMMTLPYGCGLTIVRIKSNYGNGRVQLNWKKAGWK